MKPIQFQSAKLKIQRANHHRLQLTKLLDDFYQNTATYDVVPQKIGDRYVLNVVTAAAPVPFEASLILGDAIHNVRSAFDHVIVSITGRDSKLSMPTAKTKDDLINKDMRYRDIKLKFPKFSDYIIDKLEPWEFGILSIWEMTQLDNIDKHNLLIPAYSFGRVENIIAAEANGTIHHGIVAQLVHGQVLSLREFCSPPTIISKGDGMGILLLSEPPLAGESALGMLDHCVPLCFEALNTLERVFCGNISNPDTLE